MNQFDDMETFVRIVEAGSITKAADQTNTVKSAVSKRLADLEKRLRVTLLLRTTRKQTLTDSGLSYYQHCKRLLDDVAEVESGIMNEFSALSGRIKIAAPLSFGLSHLSPALRQFNEIHPDIRFDLDFNDRIVDIVEEGFDLAIRISRLSDSSLRARKICSIKLLLCASPEYLTKYGMPKSPEDLQHGHVKVKYRSEPEMWQFRSPQGEAIAVKVPTVLTANNGDFLSQAAIDGLGLVQSPDFICYKAIRLGQLVPILTDFYPTSNNIDGYAVYPQTRHLSHRVRSFIDFLSQFYGEKAYWQG